MTISRPPKPIQAAIRKLREELGLSYAQMGIRTGLDGSTIYKLEQSGRSSMETVVAFAESFGLDVNEWREMFGYPRIEPSLTDAVRTVVTHAEELTYEPDLDEVDVSGFHGAEKFSPADIAELNRVARAVLSEKRRRGGR
ncbi:MAG: helix-turn-helix transcriptional regulator [Dehalococcoidia bacterium]|nr:helix-turn-helix transcriptional regulator [Dehalococcoidia bacterium]